jgi:hypothetical protein
MKAKLLFIMLITIMLTLTACTQGYSPVQSAENKMEPVTLNEPNITPFESNTPLPTKNDIQEKIETDKSAISSLETTPTPSPLPSTHNLIEYSVVTTENEPDLTGWILYETDDIELLARNLLEGNVIYYNGQYWCSPEYYESILNEEIVYYNDISDEDVSPGRRGSLIPDAEVIIVD